jgi:alkanesulfonate monooxygenase
MTAEYYWTLPTRGDGRGAADVSENRGGGSPRLGSLGSSIRDVRPGRYSYVDHLAHVARAAAVSGFGGVFVPFDPQGEDSWIVSAALAREIPSLAFVTEFPPTFGTPVYAAKMSATFQRFSGGRLGWKLAVEGDQAGGGPFGDHVEGPDRFVRAGEFLEVATGIWGQEGFTFKGRFFEVEEGGLRHPLSRYPRPPVTLSGATPEALALSAAHGDVHLWESPRPRELEQQKRELDRLASSQGRQLRHGVQLTVVARETAGEAWDEVRRLWLQAGAGNQDEFDRLVLAPELWSGFRLIGQHAAAAGVVGSYEQVASYLRSVHGAGIEVFYLGASPPLEEAYRFGEHVVPLLVAESAQLQAV